MQLGKQENHCADSDSHEADPEQLAAGTKHFENQQQGSQGQPVLERQVMQIGDHERTARPRLSVLLARPSTSIAWAPLLAGC